MRRFLKVTALLGLLAMMVFVVPSAIENAGMLDTIEAAHGGLCTPAYVSPGTEDIAIDRTTGWVFVSAADRRTPASDPAGKDGIYAFMAGDPGSVELASKNAPDDFHPHGISLWSDGETKRLFSVNHQRAGIDSVEIFAVQDDGALVHQDSIVFDAMQSPNDLVAVSARSFYVTNDRRYKEGLMGTLESYLGLPFSSIAYFDGSSGRIVADGLSYANGINISADGQSVYVAQILPRTISIYDRDDITGALKESRVFDVNSSPDNIDVDDDGMLWIGGHENLFAFLAHAGSAIEKAPSHVLKLDPATGGSTDIYYDPGDAISASSVAVDYKNQFYIGAVFDAHIMVCPH